MVPRLIPFLADQIQIAFRYEEAVFELLVEVFSKILGPVQPLARLPATIRPRYWGAGTTFTRVLLFTGNWYSRSGKRCQPEPVKTTGREKKPSFYYRSLHQKRGQIPVNSGLNIFFGSAQNRRVVLPCSFKPSSFCFFFSLTARLSDRLELFPLIDGSGRTNFSWNISLWVAVRSLGNFLIKNIKVNQSFDT